MNYEIDNYEYLASALGNALFSGLSQKQLWSCITQAYDVASLDSAISAQIKLNEIVYGKKK